MQGINFRLREISFKGSSVDGSLSYGAISKQLERQRQQAQLTAPASKLQKGQAQAGTSPPGISPGRDLAGHLADSLLAPDMGQTTGEATPIDYHFRKKKLRKKKRIRL